MFYHICYDAVLSLANVLDRVFENDALKLMNDKINYHCIDNSYATNISSLINEQLRSTNFTGSSVSTVTMHF